MQKHIYSLMLTASLLVLAPSAQAQYYNDNNAVMQRLDKIERDFMMMQRQVSNGEPVTVGSAPASGNIEVRLTNIEEQIRRLQGQIEESTFQSRQVGERLDKLQGDIEFRLTALEQNTAGGAGMAGAMPAPVADAPQGADTDAKATVPAPTPTPQVNGVLQAPDPNAPPPPNDGTATFSNPRDHYNYAFKLLNQTQYDAAARSFEKFIATYPQDPLAGNAYYWMGETFYIRKEYLKAADYFRQGFEATPTGPKAADNLLKLSMSLSALDRKREACVVLRQLQVKFGDQSTGIKQKADQEIKRLSCQ